MLDAAAALSIAGIRGFRKRLVTSQVWFCDAVERASYRSTRPLRGRFKFELNPARRTNEPDE
jgi:hypothetical protein